MCRFQGRDATSSARFLLGERDQENAIAGPPPCDSFFWIRNWKLVGTRQVPWRFSDGRIWPTSDSRIAAVRTSWCTAFLRSFSRNGSSTAAFSRSREASTMDWQKRRRMPTPAEPRSEPPGNICCYGLAISCIILEREHYANDSATDGICWEPGLGRTSTNSMIAVFWCFRE